MPSAMVTVGCCGGILAKIVFTTPHYKTIKAVHGNLRETGSFPERTQDTNNSGMNVMFQQQCNEVQV